MYTCLSSLGPEGDITLTNMFHTGPVCSPVGLSTAHPCHWTFVIVMLLLPFLSQPASLLVVLGFVSLE